MELFPLGITMIFWFVPSKHHKTLPSDNIEWLCGNLRAILRPWAIPRSAGASKGLPLEIDSRTHRQNMKNADDV